MTQYITSYVVEKLQWLAAACAILVAASAPQAIAQTTEADIPLCGSFLNLHFLQDQTPEEKKAAACFTEHLASCTPARIEVIIKSLHWNQKVAVHTVYEIKSREGALCVIEKKTNVDEIPADVMFKKPNIVCKIPVSFIKKIMKKAKEQGREDLIFVSLLTAIGADTITDPDTGEKLIFECLELPTRAARPH
ncbi:MAG: hypothetical protein ACE5G1_17705 [bacterium]